MKSTTAFPLHLSLPSDVAAPAARRIGDPPVREGDSPAARRAAGGFVSLTGLGEHGLPGRCDEPPASRRSEAALACPSQRLGLAKKVAVIAPRDEPGAGMVTRRLEWLGARSSRGAMTATLLQRGFGRGVGTLFGPKVRDSLAQPNGLGASRQRPHPAGRGPTGCDTRRVIAAALSHPLGARWRRAYCVWFATQPGGLG